MDQASDGGSLYIHFPYCLYKCHYCDFNSHARQLKDIPLQAYLKGLSLELEHRSHLYEKSGQHFFKPGSRLKTIFLGGGTPSLWPPELLAKLFEEVRRYFIWDDQTEVTLESNPGTITQKKLGQFCKAGVNRLSLGIQSLTDSYLASFGRIHTADQARDALSWAAEAGFKSWSGDLIFGFPGQTAKEWERDLEEMLLRNPPHLSCYSFTVEEDAPYSKMVKEGLRNAPDSDLQAELFSYTHRRLRGSSMPSYEVSNFARAGEECRHNLTYWQYEPYLGLGAGAVSFLHAPDLYRTTNIKEPGRYLAAVQSGGNCFDIENIPHQTAMGEFLMMGLRVKGGASAARFKFLFGRDVEEVYADVLRKNRDRNLLKKDSLELTEEGTLFGNQVIGDFFV